MSSTMTLLKMRSTLGSSSTKTRFTKASCKNASDKARASSYTIMAGCMKVSGLMTNGTVGGTNDSSTEIFIRGSSSKGRQTARDCSRGHTAKYTTENGSTESRKDMGFGAVKMVTHT